MPKIDIQSSALKHVVIYYYHRSIRLVFPIGWHAPELLGFSLSPRTFEDNNPSPRDVLSIIQRCRHEKHEYSSLPLSPMITRTPACRHMSTTPRVGRSTTDSFAESYPDNAVHFYTKQCFKSCAYHPTHSSDIIFAKPFCHGFV